MTIKEQHLLATWPHQQSKGKTAYLVYHASLYAIIVGAISILMSWGEAPVMDMVLSVEFLFKLMIFTLLGIVIANFKWKANTRKYDELKRLAEQEGLS